MPLEDLRRSIDQLDNELLEILAKRAELVARIQEEKRRMGIASLDPKREQAILDRLVNLGKGRLPEKAILSIFREVLRISTPTR